MATLAGASAGQEELAAARADTLALPGVRRGVTRQSTCPAGTSPYGLLG
jgi:hypothetical protein